MCGLCPTDICKQDIVQLVLLLTSSFTCGRLVDGDRLLPGVILMDDNQHVLFYVQYLSCSNECNFVF